MFNQKKAFFNSMQLRKRILDVSQKVQALHIGGSFSSAEIIETIFTNLLNYKTDRFILSKGHSGILLYTILEQKKKLRKKFLESYCQKNGLIGVHPEIGTPGVSASTGSLGHGLGIAAGMAISKKYKKIYVLISDGELMEGSVWESVLMISSFGLNNIILVIDNNDLQSATRASDTHPTLYPINKKFKAFGWNVVSVDGHNPQSIFKNIKKNLNSKKPLCIVAKTKKGFPISFMQNKAIWHYRSPNRAEYKKALKELDRFIK